MFIFGAIVQRAWGFVLQKLKQFAVISFTDFDSMQQRSKFETFALFMNS